MNSQGWIRGMMSKSYDTEQFVTHVVTTIQRQLALWNEHYEVELLQSLLKNDCYYIVVYLGEKTYKVSLSESDVARLQDEWPFALDRHIWRSLVEQGLVIEHTDGNYLTYCTI